MSPVLSPEAREFGNAVVGLADALRAAGVSLPIKKLVEEMEKDTPGRVLDQEELRWLAKFAGGVDNAEAMAELMDAIPADRVPAEISGAWFEVLNAVGAADQIVKYLTDPDDDPLAELRAELQKLIEN